MNNLIIGEIDNILEKISSVFNEKYKTCIHVLYIHINVLSIIHLNKLVTK